jgi:predicted NBD/HSP70 family sugar kinase
LKKSKRLAIKDIRIEETIDQANSGDAESIEILSRIGENLGIGIANLILTLHPELIIIGGRISRANHWILNPCMRVIKTSLPKKIFEATSIELSELYPYVSALGGVALVLNHRIWNAD